MSTPREYAAEMWRLIQKNPEATLRPFAEGGLSPRCVAMALLNAGGETPTLDAELSFLRTVPLDRPTTAGRLLEILWEARREIGNPNIDPEDGSIIVRVMPTPAALPRAA